MPPYRSIAQGFEAVKELSTIETTPGTKSTTDSIAQRVSKTPTSKVSPTKQDSVTNKSDPTNMNAPPNKLLTKAKDAAEKTFKASPLQKVAYGGDEMDVDGLSSNEEVNNHRDI